MITLSANDETSALVKAMFISLHIARSTECKHYESSAAM
jgi:hypothetical protein